MHCQFCGAKVNGKYELGTECVCARCYDKHQTKMIADGINDTAAIHKIALTERAAQFEKPKVSVTITPEEHSIAKDIAEPTSNGIPTKCKVFAKLYNRGLTWPEIERETGIPVGSLTYYRKQAEKYGLLDHKARQDNRAKRQEGKGMGQIHKAENLQMKDKQGINTAPASEQKLESKPDQEHKQVATQQEQKQETNLTPQPEPETKALDLDGLMAEFESTVRTAEKVLDLAQRCRNAAAACVQHLGEDKCQTAIKGIYQLFHNELAEIWPKKAV